MSESALTSSGVGLCPCCFWNARSHIFSSVRRRSFSCLSCCISSSKLVDAIIFFLSFFSEIEQWLCCVTEFPRPQNRIQCLRARWCVNIYLLHVMRSSNLDASHTISKNRRPTALVTQNQCQPLGLKKHSRRKQKSRSRICLTMTMSTAMQK